MAKAFATHTHDPCVFFVVLFHFISASLCLLYFLLVWLRAFWCLCIKYYTFNDAAFLLLALSLSSVSSSVPLTHAHNLLSRSASCGCLFVDKIEHFLVFYLTLASQLLAAMWYNICIDVVAHSQASILLGA